MIRTVVAVTTVLSASAFVAGVVLGINLYHKAVLLKKSRT